jgi:hypothetical protein
VNNKVVLVLATALIVLVFSDKLRSLPVVSSIPTV